MRAYKPLNPQPIKKMMFNTIDSLKIHFFIFSLQYEAKHIYRSVRQLKLMHFRFLKLKLHHFLS